MSCVHLENVEVTSSCATWLDQHYESACARPSSRPGVWDLGWLDQLKIVRIRILLRAHALCVVYVSSAVPVRSTDELPEGKIDMLQPGRFATSDVMWTLVMIRHRRHTGRCQSFHRRDMVLTLFATRERVKLRTASTAVQRKCCTSRLFITVANRPCVKAQTQLDVDSLNHSSSDVACAVSCLDHTAEQMEDQRCSPPPLSICRRAGKLATFNESEPPTSPACGTGFASEDSSGGASISAVDPSKLACNHSATFPVVLPAREVSITTQR